MLEFSDNIVSLFSYKKLWKENNRPTVVYLHNPFCKTYDNCGYCMHKGCPKKNHTEEEVEDFYFKYMPKLFKWYDCILSKQDIKLVSFGGGTPNYLSAEKFEEYLKSMPDYILKARKLIELHPALITEDFIRVLAKYNFTTAIFCFQTFDEKILKANGRLIPDYENAFKCMHLAKTLGMNVAADLITYWTTDEGWIDVLRKDFEVLGEDADEITISVLYQNKYNRDDFDGIEVYRKIQRAVNDFYPEWQNPEHTLEDCFNVAATRIYKPGTSIREDFDVYINSLSDMPWEHEQGYSTFGIGTYKNGDKAAYSMIGPDLLFYEEFIDFDTPPTIHKHRDWSFWEGARNVIKFYEDLFNGKNPPVGVTLTLQNLCKAANYGIEQFDHFKQADRCNGEWSPRLVFSGKSAEEKKREDEFFDVVSKVDKNAVMSYNF